MEGGSDTVGTSPWLPTPGCIPVCVIVGAGELGLCGTRACVTQFQSPAIFKEVRNSVVGSIFTDLNSNWGALTFPRCSVLR